MKELKFDLSDFVDIKTSEKVLFELVKRFKERRKELNWTQEELSKRSKISYGSIKRFEQTGEISFVSLLKIAEAMNCLNDFDELFSHEIINDIRG